MPETWFEVRWPDDSVSTCYSPSTVVYEFFAAGEAYALDDFLQRSKAALTRASERVAERYGRPCSRALGQLQQIEERGKRFAQHPNARIHLIRFQPEQP